jgi:hypothetical protein
MGRRSQLFCAPALAIRISTPETLALQFSIWAFCTTYARSSTAKVR